MKSIILRQSLLIEHKELQHYLCQRYSQLNLLVVQLITNWFTRTLIQSLLWIFILQILCKVYELKCGGCGLVAKLCQTLATPGTVACQAPQSIAFSRQESWSGLPFPSPGDLPEPEVKARSPALQVDSLPTELWGKLMN